MACSYKELFCGVRVIANHQSSFPQETHGRLENISTPVSYKEPSVGTGELPEKYSEFIKTHLKPTMKKRALQEADCAGLLKTFLKCEFFGAKQELDDVFRNLQHQRDFAFLLSEYYNMEKLFRLMAVRDSFILACSHKLKSPSRNSTSSQTSVHFPKLTYRTQVASELKTILNYLKSSEVDIEASDEALSTLTRLSNELLLLLQVLVLESWISPVVTNVAELISVFENCAAITSELESLAARFATNELSLKFRHIVLLISIYLIQNMHLEKIAEKLLGSEVAPVFGKSESVLNKFTNCLLMFANTFPIIGIAWFSISHAFGSSNDKVSQIGKIALANKVFNQMLMIAASSDLDMYDSVFKNIVKINFYKLLKCVLTQFEIENLVESVGIFVSLLQTLLSSPENVAIFFADLKISTEINPVGFSSVFLLLMNNFPSSSQYFLSVLSAIDQCEDAEKVYTVISRLNVGSVLSKADMSSYGGNETFELSQSKNGANRIDGWLYLKSFVMKFLLVPVGEETYNDELLSLHAITKIIYSMVKADLDMPKEVLAIVEFFPQLLGKIASDPLYNEISSETASYCFGALKYIAGVEPDLVKNELILCSIFPQLKLDRNELNECLFVCQLFPMELKISHFDGTKAFLDLVKTLMLNQNEETFYQNLQVTVNLLGCFLIPALAKELPNLMNGKLLEALFYCLSLLEEQISQVESKMIENEDVATQVLKFLVSCFLQDNTLCVDLLKLLEIGNDTLNARLQSEFVYGNFNSGVGSLLKNCLKLCLKVLCWIWSSANRFLDGEGKTYLEAKLFHENHGHCFKKIVSFLFHQFDCELPVLASRLLFTMACTKNSYFSFLDQMKAPVRDKFNRVLAKRTENAELKTAVIKLMTKSIDTQPAFLDFMLNFNTTSKKPEHPSVILPVIDLIVDDQLGGIHDYGNGKIVISDDYESAIELVYFMWADYQEGLQMYLKSLPKFWEQLTKVLFAISEITDPNAKTISCACSVLKTLSIQIHYNSLNNGGEKLRTVVNKFMVQGHFFIWFDALKKSTGFYIGCKRSGLRARFLLLKDLASSISQFVSVVINRVDAVSIIKQMDRDEVRTIHDCLLYCLKKFLVCEDRQVDSLISIFSMLLLNFIQQFQLTACEQVESLCEILKLAQSVDNVKTCLKLGCSVAASLTIVMQLESAPKISNAELVATIIHTCHNMVRIYVPGNLPDELYAKLMQLPELKRMCEVFVSLTSTLFLQTSSVSLYLEKLAEYDVIETYLRLLKLDISSPSSSKIACSIMSFFVQLSSYKSSAQFLAKSNIHQSLCLTLTNAMSSKSTQLHLDTSSDGNEISASCFSNFMVLAGNLLSLLEAEYLEQACDVISCFEEQIVNKFIGIYTSQTEPFLDQVLSILHFIQEFSAYMKVWRFKLSQNFENITTRDGETY